MEKVIKHAGQRVETRRSTTVAATAIAAAIGPDVNVGAFEVTTKRTEDEDDNDQPGIEHPIAQGMHRVGFAEMAAAVSTAGGLGIITA